MKNKVWLISIAFCVILSAALIGFDKYSEWQKEQAAIGQGERTVKLKIVDYNDVILIDDTFKTNTIGPSDFLREVDKKTNYTIKLKYRDTSHGYGIWKVEGVSINMGSEYFASASPTHSACKGNTGGMGTGYDSCTKSMDNIIFENLYEEFHYIRKGWS